jgi:ATP-binding cassette subfamily B (MDR/TAP) protein 1
LNGEQHELDLYNSAVDKGSAQFTKYGLCIGLSFGFFFMTILLNYCIGLYAGSVFLKEKWINLNTGEAYGIGDIITPFFSIIMGFQGAGMLENPITAIMKGRVSAATIFHILAQKPTIDQNDDSKLTPKEIKGKIEFKNCYFNYPSRPTVKVLDNLSFTVPAGKKVALVGETGCGKSTIIQLVERFYDPDQGQIFIDDVPLTEMNLTGIRAFIGYVGQEPVLFNMTIKENLYLAKKNATEAELQTALEQSNAWDFISKLEKGLDTYVGSGGCQLSGGQKQRIAIARAMLLNPSILLLDESTSALDRKNEREIQETLDNFAQGRTTITIAHRLTTIKNSDMIFCLKSGTVRECGTHDELMKDENGVYHNLIKFQFSGQEEEIEEEEESLTPKEPQQLITKLSIKKDENLFVNPDDSRRDTSKINKIDDHPTPATATGTKPQTTFTTAELWAMMGAQKSSVIIGFLFSIANGCIQPTIGWLLSGMLGAFALYLSPLPADHKTADEKTQKNVIYLGCLAAYAFIGFTMAIWSFNRGGEEVTKNLRKKVYKKFLENDIEFFDDEDNEPGKLCDKLSEDAKVINVLVTSMLGSMLQGVGSFVCGVTMACIACWQMALCVLGFFPVILILASIQMKHMSEVQKDESGNNSVGASIVQENVNNIRTVRAMNTMDDLIERFRAESNKVVVSNFKNFFGNFMFALSVSIYFFIFGVVYYLGAIFLKDLNVEYENVMKSMFCIIFAAFGAGMAASMGGDAGKAKSAAERMYGFLNRVNKVANT